MNFDLESAREILARTPLVLASLLRGLSEEWTTQNEGPDTWNPYDVVGHLIHGELTDWIPRAKHILEHGSSESFVPFDRFAQFQASAGKSMDQLLGEFSALREGNLLALDELGLTEDHLRLQGRHPELGVVTMRQLLSTWVVHDLGHIGQITRTMAGCYRAEVGPWAAYLRLPGGER